MAKHEVSLELNGTTFSLETGRMAKQAGGSVVVRQGDTMALVCVVADTRPTEKDFLPLFVEYRNKTYAAGRIPGGFFKREGRPSDRETLSARLIDRPLRPLFPDGWKYETQIVSFIISADEAYHADVLSITAASAALNLSDVPFPEYVSGVRVAEIDGEFVINPSYEQVENSPLNLIVAGTDDIVGMIEGECREISEEKLLDAIDFAQGWIRKLNALQRELVQAAGSRPKREHEPPAKDADLEREVEQLIGDDLRGAVRITGKQERQDAVRALQERVAEKFVDEEGNPRKEALAAFGALEKRSMRGMILRESVRSDGRDLATVRPITIETGVLPRAHGSALFTRGETQALGTTTLGTKVDEQLLEPLGLETHYAKYYLHYNFPPFSVGETGRYAGQGRREIGHGKLAERAIQPVLPTVEDFPYTIRIVSDILESNGSSSMATICAGSLSLMDAGVPLRRPVAGVAMGLIKEEEQIAILTDILGVEDHLGDMDFKVAGTEAGITAFQLDTKIAGISRQVMTEALERARQARQHILGEMAKALPQPREELSQYAPKIVTIKIPVKRIGDLIGPGGKVIKQIQEDTGANIEVNDEGQVFISSANQSSGQAALEIIEAMMTEPEINKVYKGKVKTITDFGAFVEYLPGRDGLLHISELEHFRVGNVEDVLSVGDEVEVKLVEIDGRTGKVRLSRKALLPVPEGMEVGSQSGHGSGRGREGGRSGGRGREGGRSGGHGREGGDDRHRRSGGRGRR
jgi:polyribonucleotide nucleotidyltransferase